MEENGKRVVKALDNKVKAMIYLLLSIYNELSTKELAEKLEKSKPTVLRNIQDLIDMEFIQVREDYNKPGKYPMRLYSLNTATFTVKGQDFRSSMEKELGFALVYNDYRLGWYYLLKFIVDSSIDYLARLRKEVEKNLEDSTEIGELMKDNLGHLGFYYLTKLQVRKLNEKGFSKLDEIMKEGKKDELNDYLLVQMLLPVKRLVEMRTKDEWEKDGSLWQYDEE
ncbi:MAG: winged helix-turn-helix domain-containing protein [Candidatus Odinarchaeota archaeon]